MVRFKQIGISLMFLDDFSSKVEVVKEKKDKSYRKYDINKYKIRIIIYVFLIPWFAVYITWFSALLTIQRVIDLYF